MVKVNILKSGRFGFDGFRTTNVVEGEMDLKQSWADQICATSWAEFANVDSKVVNAVVKETIEPEPASGVDNDSDSVIGNLEPEWSIVEKIEDKKSLDEYAGAFGVSLDRRKSLGKMKAAFKAEFE